MTERDNGIHLDYSMLSIADPHAGIAPERKLTVLNNSPYAQKLLDAENGRDARIVRHQQNAAWEGAIMDQRRAEMEEIRQMRVQSEIAA